MFDKILIENGKNSNIHEMGKPRNFQLILWFFLNFIGSINKNEL